ncbi:hypothetical protein [Microscilla marina]|uniref:Uncharacterized protein n=1 Tax=Microscilla marina ATCC 23134 TaxID=313606 RepID=A1ZC23_MICM2|nr:hypothetical protein [Microscilla marina]EAY31825.1 hypothetical protein M23134_01854 [Microscilla marina ATCC 23134]
MGRTLTKESTPQITNTSKVASGNPSKIPSHLATDLGTNDTVKKMMAYGNTEQASFPAKVAAPQIPQGSPQTLHKKIKQPKAVIPVPPKTPPKTKPYTVDKQGRVIFDEGITPFWRKVCRETA